MIVSVKKLNVLWTHQSKGSDDSKIVEADFSKFRIEFEDHENLRRPNCEKPSLDRRNVGNGISDLWIMCLVKKRKAYLLRKVSFTLPEVISNINSLKLGLWKFTIIFGNIFSMTNEYNLENEV